MSRGSKNILSHRHRLYVVPLLAVGAAYAFFELRTGIGGTPRLAVEMVAAGGLGFLLAAAWTWFEDAPAREGGRGGKHRKPFIAGEQIQITENQREIWALREEIRQLEGGLHTYLRDKKNEGQRLRDAILDLNHDVTRLKDTSPVDALKPQLETIASKFGELAGVRQVVSRLSSKVRRVEDLAAQVAGAEARVKQAAADGVSQDDDLSALRKELKSLKGEMGGDLSAVLEAHNTALKEEVGQLQQKVGEKVDQAVRDANANFSSRVRAAVQPVDIEDVVDKVHASLDELIESRVQALITGLRRVSSVGLPAVPDPAEIARPHLRIVPNSAAHQAAPATSHAQVAAAPSAEVPGGMLETLERRLQKMASTIDQLKDRIESMRFDGPVAESSISSSAPTRRAAPVSSGINMKDPANAMKSGALAKIFQANLAIQQAAAA